MSIEKFHEVNDPRIEKVMHTIRLIEKSAASYRCPEEGAKLLQRAANYLTPHAQLPAPKPTPAPELRVAASPAAPSAPATVTPPIARQWERFENMDTQQLVDVMITCGAILAERRK